MENKVLVAELLKRIAEMSRYFDSLAETGLLPDYEFWEEWRQVCGQTIAELVEKRKEVARNEDELLRLTAKIESDYKHATLDNLERWYELLKQRFVCDKESDMLFNFIRPGSYF